MDFNLRVFSTAAWAAGMVAIASTFVPNLPSAQAQSLTFQF